MLRFAGLIFWIVAAVPRSLAAAPPVDFNRDVRPILSDHCYACHGPDENKRKGGLRLDRQEDAFRELKSGQRALVAGDTNRSSLVARILTQDADELMPPPKHLKPLTPEQIGVLVRWVREGAKWQEHWSFVAPKRPELPPVKDRRWPKNELDHFILARLEQAGIRPNAEADRAAEGFPGTITLTPAISGEAFLTEQGPFTELVAGAVEAVSGQRPDLSTTGGTSDARFIRDLCPVVELGLVGRTMHAVDERAPVEEIRRLQSVYETLIRRYFAAPPSA
jgi:hypothetical protein